MVAGTGTVYLPHTTDKFDVEDAKRFGRLRVIFRKELYPDEVDDLIDSVTTRAEDALSGFDPDRDYLCLVGSPVYTVLCAFLIGRQHDSFRVLRYDRLERCYYPIDIRDPVQGEDDDSDDIGAENELQE